MKKLALSFILALASCAPVVAQTSNGRATTAAPTYTNNTAAPLSLDTSGNLRVNCVTGCGGGGGGGSVDITAVGGNAVTTTVPISGTVTATGPLTDTELRASPVPVAFETATNFSAIGAATTNSTLVASGARTLTEISVYNIGTNAVWLKLYNTAAAPTCGSGTPVGRYLIPAEGGSNVPLAQGKAFSSGIGFCLTTGIADNNTTAIPADEVTVNFTYR